MIMNWIKKILKKRLSTKRSVKNWKEMTLFEQYQHARNRFQHYAIRSMYDTNDGFRHIITNEERQRCVDMANKWDSIIKDLRLKILTYMNQL